MILSKFLADVNILIALTEQNHIHHSRTMDWFDSQGRYDWGVCAFSQAGFLRVATNPKTGRHSMAEGIELLRRLSLLPGYRCWQIVEDWNTICPLFENRIFGHQQVTDAWLLGLAVRENGILVTMDKGIQFLAGAQYRKHVLILE
jgi:uncharacterized protein